MVSKKRKEKRANPKSKTGVCALLGVDGKFAKSHLIPLALTSPDKKGERFIESGRGFRPIRRFTSWFDHQLVTDDGEKILSKIDTAGIDELRKHKLVWSGWGSSAQLSVSDYVLQPTPEAEFGIRSIAGADSSKIRLFFLSLLWRCLKTQIKEFSYLPREGVDLDRLGTMIVAGDPGAFDYHPVMLTQMNTRGFTHNYSPTYHEVCLPDDEGGVKSGYYRLYMQGLIAHIYPASCADVVARSGGLLVGAAPNLAVLSRSFEGSKQLAEAKDEILTANKEWPGSVS